MSWSEPLSLDNFGAEFRMPSGEKKGVIDERAEEVFGGDHWQEITALNELPQAVRKNWWYPQPPHQGHVRNIHIHPDDPETIYLCLEHGGIVRSFDRGKSWEDVSKGID